jgi:hypothetical protein
MEIGVLRDDFFVVRQIAASRLGSQVNGSASMILH